MHGENGVGLAPCQGAGRTGFRIVQSSLQNVCRYLDLHQSLAGRVRVAAGPDDLDDLVDVSQGDQKTFDNVGSLAGLLQLVRCPASDHHLAVLNKEPQHLLERQHPGPSVDKGQIDDREAVLKR